MFFFSLNIHTVPKQWVVFISLYGWRTAYPVLVWLYGWVIVKKIVKMCKLF